MKNEDIYSNVKNILTNARKKAYSAVNFAMVEAYWNVGKMIVENEQNGNKQSEYGEYLIKFLSKRLTEDFGNGFNATNLKYMRQFYISFPIGHALRDQLSWTHYRLLLKIKDESKKKFYIDECIQNNWSRRQLERQINSFYYERLLSTQNKFKDEVRNEIKTLEPNIKPDDILKDPYVLEFLNLNDRIKFSEKDLESDLIDNLQEFLLELGKGFSFVGRQKRITVEGDHFYIDLVFYNYLLKCFVLIDLKLGKLTHQDIGQMDFYVRYFEKELKTESDNPTIGIILCSEKNEAMVKYSVLEESKQLFASKYMLYMPTEEELIMELSKERQRFEIEESLAQYNINELGRTMLEDLKAPEKRVKQIEKEEIEKIIIDTIPKDKTEAIYIFGSYNTEFFDDDSDIDIGWFCKDVTEKERVLLECDLEEKIGRAVDLLIPDKNKILILNEILAGKWIGELSDEFCEWFDDNITDIQDQAEDLIKLM